MPGIGLLPATVPGAFGAWLTMLRDYGTWTLADALAPAIAYARDGFPLVPRISQAILAVRELFQNEWHSSANVWLPDGRVPRPGTLHATPGVARTYTGIVETAEAAGGTREQQIDAALDCWYRGFVAREIDSFCRTQAVRDTTGERHKGLLRHEDMADWTPTVEAPATLDFGRYTVAKCGIWSQGPAFLQQIGMLRHADLAAHAPTSPEFVHRIAEAAKLAMADRLAWYGDPRFGDAPLAGLLDPAYLAARARADWRARLARHPARHRRGPHAPPARSRRGGTHAAASRCALRRGRAHFRGDAPGSGVGRARDLCRRHLRHIDVIDRHGNMVAATPSGGWLSSSPVIPELGFALNTRLQMTWLEPGLPNTLAPGKRPCTTLSPSLALRDGEPYMVFGTPGGDQQDQWSVAFFLRHAVHGMEPAGSHRRARLAYRSFSRLLLATLGGPQPAQRGIAAA
ncbi:gamma-glutamyltransferase family protein [Cupriavidus basilensis]